MKLSEFMNTSASPAPHSLKLRGLLVITSEEDKAARELLAAGGYTYPDGASYLDESYLKWGRPMVYLNIGGGTMPLIYWPNSLPLFALDEGGELQLLESFPVKKKEHDERLELELLGRVVGYADDTLSHRILNRGGGPKCPLLDLVE